MGGTTVGADSSDTQDSVGFLQTINDYLNLQGKMATIQQCISDHPIITLFLVVTMVMCSVPLFCFLVFVFAATTFGFTGFVIFEGVVLMLSSLVLVGSLILVGFLSVGLSSFIVIGYYSIRFSWDMANHVSTRVPLPEFVSSRLPDGTRSDKDM
ncbi:uncharacterized protein LOC132548780 [Ylistrum balloti]|uniref:uncharacterized protein LOC132548780 n=1 Tax=Ylistrum balloti TaxID=509963 RepID=UPI0029058D53|nr:uncharacterized protein LOC132548780 [Ylistrum balloti]